MVLLVGNWKMAPEKSVEAQKLAKSALSITKKYRKKISVVICPPSVHLSTVAKISKALTIGAQGVSESKEIAQTGQISAGMLKSLGVKYCIVGHSEMRAQGVSNDTVAGQVIRLLEKKITPVVCVGETVRDHQGWYLSVVKDQLESFLSILTKAMLKNIVIAYEPVWAIGRDAVREATTLECREMVIYIRKIISDHFGAKAGDVVRIIYGGSVDDKNAKSFIVEGSAEGILVGRVSLDPKRFGALASSLVS